MSTLADRIHTTTTTTGTGTVTVSTAALRKLPLSTLADGTVVPYAIEGQGVSTEWEMGYGTIGASGTALARTTVVSSSNSNSAVSFSAGTKDVFVTLPSSMVGSPWCAVGGTADAITLTYPANFPSYTLMVGTELLFVASGANTGSAPTIAVNGLAALASTMGSVATPIGGLISGNKYRALLETSTSWRIAPYDSVSSNGDTFNGPVTWSFDGDQQHMGGGDASKFHLGGVAAATGVANTLLGGADFFHWGFAHNVQQSSAGAITTTDDSTSTSYLGGFSDAGRFAFFQAPAVGGAGAPTFGTAATFDLDVTTGIMVLKVATSTASKSCHLITESVASTNGVGAQYLVDIQTLAGSTAEPFRVKARGGVDNILVSRTGAVTVTASAGATNSTGTQVNAAAGAGNGSGAGGTISITGGANGATGAAGGGANLIGGAGGTTSGSGGGAGVYGGTANYLVAANGGPVQIVAGAAGNTGTGGPISITSGDGGLTSGNTGAITIDTGVLTSGTHGIISIGNTNCLAVNIGRSSSTTTFTGSVIHSTAAQGTNTTQSATTAFVVNEFGKHKNYLVDGNLQLWPQGAGPFTTSATYSAVAIKTNVAGDTFSLTQGAFVSGDALYNPTVGNIAAQYYYTNAITSVAGAGNFCNSSFAIEDVRRLAGKTVTVSFWAKAASGTPSIALEIAQIFGTGGSPSATATGAGQAQALTTSWAKYTKTFTIPTLSGITPGTDANSTYSRLTFWLDAGSTYNTRAASIGQATKTVSIAQVQMEEGSVATQFVDTDPQANLESSRRYLRVSDFIIPGTLAQNLGTIDMRAVPTISGGGAGFTSTGTTADSLIGYQTTGAVQTLTLDARF